MCREVLLRLDGVSDFTTRLLRQPLAPDAEACVRAIAASHRVGTLVVGDAALVAAVSADHREAAFITCARLIDAVKARLPVWKHQFFADGADEWVNSA
jgi:molybdopterin synthase catalytic subunit